MSFSLRNRNKKELTLAPPPAQADSPSALSPLFTPIEPDHHDGPSSTASSSNHHDPSASSLTITTSAPSPRSLALLHPSPRGLEFSLGSPFRFDSDIAADSILSAQQQETPIPPPSSTESSSFSPSPYPSEPDVEMMTRASRTPLRERHDDVAVAYPSENGLADSELSASYEARKDVSGVGTMETRKAGGSWPASRPPTNEPAADRPRRADRAGYAHLSASAGPSSAPAHARTSRTESSTFSPYPAQQDEYPPPHGGRPPVGQRSFSTSSNPSGGWTPQEQTQSSSYSHHHPRSVPSHPHHPHDPSHAYAPAFNGSESVPPQQTRYYSPQPPPSHDPYGSTATYGHAPPPPSSYHPHPMSYPDPQRAGPAQHGRDPYPVPPRARPTSSGSRPGLPTRAKSSNDTSLRSARGSVSSGSTLRKKKSSVAMASSFSRAGVFPPSPHISQPGSRHQSPSAQAALETPSTSTSSSSSTATLLDPTSNATEQRVPPKQASPKKYHGPVRTEGHVARPPNSWILYRSHTIKLMTEAKEKDVDPPIPADVWDHPLAVNLDRNMRHQADMSTLISVMWKCESDEVKKKYAKLSLIAKHEHQAANPGYKYKPVRKAGATAASYSVAPGSPRNKQPIILPAARAFHASPPPPPSRKAPKKKAKPSRKQTASSGDDAMDGGQQGWEIPLSANALEGLEPGQRYEAMRDHIQAEMHARQTGQDDEGEWTEYEQVGPDGYPLLADGAMGDELYEVAQPNRTFDSTYEPPSSGFHPSQLAAASSYDFAVPQAVTYDLGPLVESTYPPFPEDATTASTGFTYEEYPAYTTNAEAGPSSYADMLQAPALYGDGLGLGGMESTLPDDDPNHFAAMWCLLDEDPSGAQSGDQAIAPFDVNDASQWTDGTWDMVGEGGLAVPTSYDGFGDGTGGGGAGEMVMVGSEGGMTVAELVRQQWEQDRQADGQTGGGDPSSLAHQLYDNSFEYDPQPGPDLSYGDVAVEPQQEQWNDPHDPRQHQQNGYQPSSQPAPPNHPQPPYRADNRRRYRAPPTPNADQLTFPESHAPALAPPLPLDAQPGYLRLKTSNGQLQHNWTGDTRWTQSYEQQHHAYHHPVQQALTAPPPQSQPVQGGWSPSWQLSPPSPAPLGETQAYYAPPPEEQQYRQQHHQPGSSTTYNPNASDGYRSLSGGTSETTTHMTAEIFSPPRTIPLNRSVSVELGDEQQVAQLAQQQQVVFDEPVSGAAGEAKGKAVPRRGGRVVGGSYKP